MAKKTVKIEQLFDVITDFNEVLELEPIKYDNDPTKEDCLKEINDTITSSDNLIRQEDVNDFVEETKETLELLGYDVENIEQYKEPENNNDKENKKEEVKEKPKKKVEKKVNKEKEIKKEKKEVEDKYTRADSFVDSLKKQKGKFTVVTISKESDELFVKKTGNKSSYNGAKNYSVFSLPILLRLNIVSKEGSKYKYIGE